MAMGTDGHSANQRVDCSWGMMIAALCNPANDYGRSSPAKVMPGTTTGQLAPSQAGRKRFWRLMFLRGCDRIAQESFGLGESVSLPCPFRRGLLALLARWRHLAEQCLASDRTA